MTKELDLSRDGGNGNRGLRWPDLEARQMRAELAAEIIRVLRGRRLSQRKAAEVTGLAQPDISRINNADLKGFTIDRLVTVLNRLGRHVAIRVTPAAREAIPLESWVESGSTPSDPAAP